MEVRQRQREALDASKARYDAGVFRQVISLATGMGKTVIMANIRRWFSFTKKILILVHTDKLAKQAVEKYEHWNKTERVGLEMGQSYSSPSDTCIVASVQTLGRDGTARINRFNPEDFDVVITDECHHGVASTYERIYTHFGFVPKGTSTRLSLGVTATTRRGDGQGLDKVFDEIVYEFGLLAAIREGWLCNIRGFRVRSTANLDTVSSSNGSLNNAELSLAVNTPERNRAVVDEWLKVGEDRQTVAFCVDIQHAKDLAKAFCEAGILAKATWGIDPDQDQTLEDHEQGKLKVLCNSDLLIEGYDNWRISCIINAKPTKSQAKFEQIAGRGTRLPDDIANLLEAIAAGIVPRKTDYILIDVADNTKKHSLASLASLVGLPKKLDFQGMLLTDVVAAMEEAEAKSPETDFSSLEDLSNIQSFIEQVDLFATNYATEVVQNSELQWHKSPKGNYMLLLPNNEKVIIGKDFLGNWNIDGSVLGKKFNDTAHSIEEAFDSADKMVRMFGKNLVQYVRRHKPVIYGKAKATAAQISAIGSRLKKLGKPAEDVAAMSSVDAAKRLIELYKR